MMRISALSVFTILFFSCVHAQMEDYSYKRELKGVSAQWHRIELPNEVFGKIAGNSSDIRIFGITPGNDTIEAPYILRLMSEKVSTKEIVFNMLNTSSNENGHFFTFEVSVDDPVDRIELEFEQENFEWRTTLEGSQDQKEWFTVVEDQRILSIKNGSTDFQFTVLEFPSSKYRYFRLRITGDGTPELIAASIYQREIVQGSLRNYPVKRMHKKEDRTSKRTGIDVRLEMPVPVGQVKITVLDTFDYYRPVTIKYLVDSFQTEKGWIHNYRTLGSGTLNSFEKNGISCSATILQEMKVLVEDQDNEPLNIDRVEVQGYVHELLVRTNVPATYFLTYGNDKAQKPRYDIERFTDRIPAQVTEVQLGEEVTIDKEVARIVEPLFQNKAWLWAVMAVIILLLGGFSLRMMRKQ